jgi:hypothetical protein
MAETESTELTGSGSSPVIAGDGDPGLPETHGWVKSNQEMTKYQLVAAL